MPKNITKTRLTTTITLYVTENIHAVTIILNICIEPHPDTALETTGRGVLTALSKTVYGIVIWFTVAVAVELQCPPRLLTAISALEMFATSWCNFNTWLVEYATVLVTWSDCVLTSSDSSANIFSSRLLWVFSVFGICSKVVLSDLLLKNIYIYISVVLNSVV